ncbi:CDP-glycerol glycerophosphotransferase family protein [Paraburkholderia caffeinilytica]|uniref:CDP-glycerol glycerophosphotransferase family protein n=1 Tax=Paraburkholderia caffeinilytica TaxID=1761016 RepID=UPI0038BA8BB0
MVFSEKKFEIFDEETYLSENLDVLNAVESGVVNSGYAHFLNHGQAEGRRASSREISLSQINEAVEFIKRRKVAEKICENFSHVSKRKNKKNTIIFYTPRHFEGNLKYVYLEMMASIKRDGLDVSCFFLTLNLDTFNLLKDLNLPVLLWQKSGSNIVKHLLDAAIVVDDGFFVDGPPNPPLLYAYLSGALRINLWHGTPLRKILLQKLGINREINLHYSTILKAAVDNNVFCAAAPGDYDLFMEAMVIDEFFVTGYARNDIFYRNVDSDDLLNVDEVTYSHIIEKRKSEKIALYAPTWRDGRPDWVRDIKLGELAAELKRRGIHLVVNLHPFEMHGQKEFLDGIPNITLIKENTDIYPILKNVDVLITDYSSIVFDYLHAGKPVIYFRPDHELYLSGNRALIAERVDRIPAPVTNDAETCSAAVANVLTDTSYPEVLKDEIETAHYYRDANSSRRCVAVILKSLDSVLSSQPAGRPKFIDEAL